jgi:uncharacterized protein YcbK (DUF882 family)
MAMKYFKRDDFACKCGCGFKAVDRELSDVLTDIREHFDSPLYITNACRCTKHNAEVGGRPNSYHIKAMAADISVKGVTPERVQDYVLNKYPNSKGIGCYNTFTHIDVRDVKARW